jgi:hypothetical protein
MLTRRAYKRYVPKGGTKSKKSKKSKSSDIIDTSELEKPKVFSIQDVHDFLLRKKEPKGEYRDENQKEIDDYVKKSIDYDDEFEDEPLSEQDKLRLEELLIQTDSEDEEDYKEEKKIDNDPLRDIVADTLTDEVLDMAQKELQEEELIKDGIITIESAQLAHNAIENAKKELQEEEEEAARKTEQKELDKRADNYYKLFYSNSPNELVTQTTIIQYVKNIPYEELIEVYNKSQRELQKMAAIAQMNLISTGLEADIYNAYFKRMEWTNNYSTKEIFRRNVLKMGRENMIEVLNWLDDTRNENERIPIKELENIFIWKSDRENLIGLIKHEKYTREMKEIPSCDDMIIFYNFISSPEYERDFKKTHLAKDKPLLLGIWYREYKNKYLKEELAKGRRYEDIKDDLEADLKPSGVEERKDEQLLETDSDADIYE